MNDKFKIVNNSPFYFEFIRLLRNDERVKSGFIQQEEISKEQQIEYMNKYKDNYWICLYENVPCGYVGVIDGDIRIATSPNYQNMGVGIFMLDFLKTKFRKEDIYAKIKIDNQASIKLFEKAGYKLQYYLYKLT